MMVTQTRSHSNRIIRKDYDEDTSRSRLEHFVRSSSFEVFFAFIIALNVFIMALEVQYRGEELGDAANLSVRPAAAWPYAHNCFNIALGICGVAFTVELLLKLLALKLKLFKS